MKRIVIYLTQTIMKKVTFLIAVVTCSSQLAVHAQTGSGVYRSAADYSAKKMDLEVNCTSEKHIIRLHEFWSKPYIDIIHDGEKHTFQKKDIFGFRDCAGTDFRFFENKHYKILESGKVLLYAMTTNRPAPTGKGFYHEVKYYFSTAADAPLQDLTLDNLKQAWPKNNKLHMAIDA